MVVIMGQNPTRPKDSDSDTVAENSAQQQIQALRQQQRLLPGLLAGLIALVIGVLIWAGATIFTGRSMGWMVIGVGLMVGFAIQFSGRSEEPIFGWMGAALVLLGCGVGNVFAVCGLASQAENIPLLSLCASMTPALAFKLSQQTFKGIDLFFYVLAIYAGYRFSLRRQRTKDGELNKLLI